jgi:hypothetical protein
MNRSMFESRRSNKGSIAVSLAVHVVVIALIASITFRYPLAAFFGIDKDKTPLERIQYVKVAPRQAASVGNGASESKAKPKKAVQPAQLLAPTVTPTALPPVQPPEVSAGAVSGSATGSGGAPVGAATGLEPATPDSRIELRPHTTGMPLTMAQKNDSAVKAIYMAYRDAELAAEENRGRNPRDWTFEHNGQKYGVDSQWVYLGKFKLPSAILAALPFNYGGVDGNRIIQSRNANWIQQDIYTHSQGLSEDDFRAAVKRIRERKDRERKDAEDKGAKPNPIVP